MARSIRPVVCYTDVGGTFTDCFVVDENGEFALGKAPTTPAAIADGFLGSLAMARQQTGLTSEEFLQGLEVIGYGATTVLNAVLTRQGGQPGLIVTRGFEDLLTMERGKQSWAALPRADRIHPVTHRHLRPIVPRRLVRGVTGRVNSLGHEVIPLREADVLEAARDLLDAGVDSICVVLLWSFLDDHHERRCAELIRQVEAERRADLPVYLSCDISPVIRELPRANAATVEAFAGPSTLRALATLEGSLKTGGFGGNLQVMQSSGGLAGAGHVRAIHTMRSGPVGGLVGTRYIGEVYGLDNLISTDVGGTSFDVGLVSGGFIGVDREPEMEGLLLPVPMMEVHSIGAGGGTIARIDPLTGRLEVGPRSAGSVPGPVCYAAGGTEPTVTDADLVLGYLNHEGLLGGTIKVDPPASWQAIKTHIADPLGLSVEEAAVGIRQVIDTRMREAVAGLVAQRGSRLQDYVLLGFGGAGPAHLCGYTEGLPLRGVMTFPYAAVFSAFGASAADYEHHYQQAVNVVIPPGAADDHLAACGQILGSAWENLEGRALLEMCAEGFEAGQVRLQHVAMVRYGRQLNDLITPSPVSRCHTAADLRAVLDAFQDLYARVFAEGAQFPQSGFEVLEVGLVASAVKVKPQLVKYPLAGADPSGARSDRRPTYWNEDWIPTPRYQWAGLKPGNVILGPAVVEADTTTLVLPPGRIATIDPFRSVWIEDA